MNVSFVFNFICAFNESFWVIVQAHLELSRLAVLLAEAIRSIFSTLPPLVLSLRILSETVDVRGTYTVAN